MSRNPPPVHLGARAGKHLTLTEIEEPASGGPGSAPRSRYKADAAKALHPTLLGSGAVVSMTGGCHRSRWLSPVSVQRPPVLRPGAEDANRLPSRVGRTLRWPDGRVNPIDNP